jgi:hypothetical protein
MLGNPLPTSNPRFGSYLAALCIGPLSALIRRSAACPICSETSLHDDWAAFRESAAAKAFKLTVCPAVAADMAFREMVCASTAALNVTSFKAMTRDTNAYADSVLRYGTDELVRR